MTGIGVGQIILYVVVLVALTPLLGGYMARVYLGSSGLVRRLGGGERLFLRVVGDSGAKEQDWKSYSKTVLVFSAVFFGILYGLLRLQGHLFLNPDGLSAVSPTVAFNTAVSFVTNTNWQYYGGEYTMSYLSQMAGLAVQNFVSAAVGMAVLAAVCRGFAGRSTKNLGNFWQDVYRSIVYILLPLSIALALVLVGNGIVQTFSGAETVTTLEGAQQTIARGPAASQIAIKQLGTNGGGFYNSNSAVPFENSERAHQLPRGALHPADPGGVHLHVRQDGRLGQAGLGDLHRDARDVRDRRRDRAPDGAARLPGASRRRRQPHGRRRTERRELRGQGGPVRDRQHRALGRRDDRCLERLGERRPRFADGGRRRRPARQHVRRGGHLRRRRLGHVRDAAVRPARRLRLRSHGRADARIPRKEDRVAGGEDRRGRAARPPADGARR